MRVFRLALLSVLIGTCRTPASGQHPEPKVEPTPPADVEIPSGHVGNPIAFFDDMSWRTFIALNWPAKPARRGEADTGKTLGDDAESVVWETWKSDFEIFQPGGQRPAPWQSFATVSPCKDLPLDRAGFAKVLTSGAQGLAMSHYNQASFGVPSGSLAAQNRTYARYEVRVNQTEFEFIRGDDDKPHRWHYLRANLPTGSAPSLIFPAGSIEIKAAWRELDPEHTEASRYYTRSATLVDPDGNCRQQLMGLVGLHIVHRTPTMREWVWSTFEHIDNLSDAPQGIDPSFNNRMGPQDPTDPTVNRLLPIVDESHPPHADPEPAQVVRVKPIHASTRRTNEKYHNHPGISPTVWANYRLVMTQWPTAPSVSDSAFRAGLDGGYPMGAGSPFPDDTDAAGTAISNSTMETLGVFQQSVSCMRCHHSRGAAPEKTEFVWFLRLRAHPSDGAPERAVLEVLRSSAQRTFDSLTRPGRSN